MNGFSWLIGLSRSSDLDLQELLAGLDRLVVLLRRAVQVDHPVKDLDDLAGDAELGRILGTGPVKDEGGVGVLLHLGGLRQDQAGVVVERVRLLVLDHFRGDREQLLGPGLVLEQLAGLLAHGVLAGHLVELEGLFAKGVVRGGGPAGGSESARAAVAEERPKMCPVHEHLSGSGGVNSGRSPAIVRILAILRVSRPCRFVTRGGTGNRTTTRSRPSLLSRPRTLALILC